MFDARISWLEAEIERLYGLGTQGEVFEAARLAQELRNLKQAGGTSSGGVTPTVTGRTIQGTEFVTMDVSNKVAKLTVPTNASYADIWPESASTPGTMLGRYSLNNSDPGDMAFPANGILFQDSQPLSFSTRDELVTVRFRKLDAIATVTIQVTYF